MNMRLARPAQLVDLNRLSELNYLKIEGGELRIGAMTRQRALERSKVVGEGWPLLQEATRYIGHVQIRNRGTVGGSLVHAYPSAALPVVMTALEATLVMRTEKSERLVRAEDFFVDVMTTVLQPVELLIEIREPQVRPRTGWSFQEVASGTATSLTWAWRGLLTLSSDGPSSERNLFLRHDTASCISGEQQLIGRW
jgi:CO/xanthine dehydrogenase FAD-binding subunit